MTERVNSADDAVKVVQAWNEAWMARDLERMKEIAAADYVQWHATVRKDLTKDQEFAMLTNALKVLQVHFKAIKLTPLSDGAVLQQCVADVAIEGMGSANDVPFAMVFQTRGTQITRCDEYMDGQSLPRIDFTPKS
jgi:ketosteroid isomerase-like protein